MLPELLQDVCLPHHGQTLVVADGVSQVGGLGPEPVGVQGNVPARTERCPAL
jgi:hypothetical protein